MEFIRPSSKEDIEYRQKQYDEYDKKIKEIVPDDLHLCFHGCPIFAAKHIIEDGELSSSVDRLGRATSYDVEDQVSVTTKNTIETTLRGYAGLNGNFELPAGCIFAILPKNEEEIKSSESSMLIGNVPFKDNPERLYSIITTPENIEKVSEWAKNANIDLSKIHDYDSFIKEMERNVILQKMKNGEQLSPSDILALQEKPLTNVEAFSIVEDNPERIEEYTKFDKLKEDADNGELTEEQLKFLCDTAFGIDTEESKKVYEEMIKNGRVKQSKNEKELFSEQEIGKSTVSVPTQEKYKSKKFVDKQLGLEENDRIK